MKKLFSILLCALLAFSTVAMAETVKLEENTDRFDITLTLPEGAALPENSKEGDYSFATATLSGVADVIIVLAPSEEYADQSLADLSDEERNALMELTLADWYEPVSKIDVTPSGNQYMIIRSDGNDASVATVFTLYRGYFVQLTQFNDDFSTLDDADIEFMMNILYGIEFEEVTQP